MNPQLPFQEDPLLIEACLSSASFVLNRPAVINSPDPDMILRLHGALRVADSRGSVFPRSWQLGTEGISHRRGHPASLDALEQGAGNLKGSRGDGYV